jgi:dienelactone hydrolase
MSVSFLNYLALAASTLLLMANLVGCINAPSSGGRLTTAINLANNQHWQVVTLPSQPFELKAFIPRSITDNTLLTIYIEGDGLTWLTKSIVSLDPTPINPTALKLALQHRNGNAAYLARPCQYRDSSIDTTCQQKHWTNERFSQDVISATNIAIDQLKTQFNATEIQLVGYSGGGAVAALAASQREDVIQLVTVAGNLNHQRWTKHHQISPLTGSLNPIDAWSKLTTIQQIHFVGGRDNIIPPTIALHFQELFNKEKSPEVIVIDEMSHHCCWVEQWPILLKRLKPSVAVIQ